MKAKPAISDDEHRQMEIFTDLADLALARCYREYRNVANLMEDREQKALLAMILAAEFVMYAEKLGIRRAHVMEAVTEIVDRSQ